MPHTAHPETTSVEAVYAKGLAISEHELEEQAYHTEDTQKMRELYSEATALTKAANKHRMRTGWSYTVEKNGEPGYWTHTQYTFDNTKD